MLEVRQPSGSDIGGRRRERERGRRADVEGVSRGALLNGRARASPEMSRLPVRFVGADTTGGHQMAASGSPLFRRAGNHHGLSEGRVMTLCNHDLAGVGQARIGSGNVRARFGVVPQPSKLCAHLGLGGIVDRDRQGRVLILHGERRRQRSVIVFLRRKNRKLGHGRHHANCSAHLAFSIHRIAVRHPDIAAAAALDDGDTSAGAALVFVRPFVSRNASRRRRAAKNISREIASSVEEALGDRKRRPEEEVERQKRGRESNR